MMSFAHPEGFKIVQPQAIIEKRTEVQKNTVQ